ncbi:hypothetical protein COBT_001420, partial [Conglomerata obtusa]
DIIETKEINKTIEIKEKVDKMKLKKNKDVSNEKKVQIKYTRRDLDKEYALLL